MTPEPPLPWEIASVADRRMKNRTTLCIDIQCFLTGSFSVSPRWNFPLQPRRLVYLNRRPRLVRGVADVFHRTCRALGSPRDAQRATVMNDLVGEIDPFPLRNRFHQVLLDVFRIVGLGQLQASRDAMHVSINHD